MFSINSASSVRQSAKHRRATSELGSKTTRSKRDGNSHKESSALSMVVDSRRQAAIDMSVTDDVSTLVCLEVSRATMLNPDINLGSFFRLAGASKHSTNKSDAVIVISAAILEMMGNSKMARRILDKSRTVTKLYEQLRLDDENVRQSVVIMLFAIAPEFIKALETSITMSLNRIKSVTTAPYADQRMQLLAGELLRTDAISASEHTQVMDDFSAINLGSDTSGSPSSIQHTPISMIKPSDSASNYGSVVSDNTVTPMNTIGLMRYVKKNPEAITDNFYREFPNARRPVHVTPKTDNSGIGYKAPMSAVVTSNDDENVLDMINNLLLTESTKQVRPLNRRDPINFKHSRVDSAQDNTLHVNTNFKSAMEQSEVNRNLSAIRNQSLVNSRDVRHTISDLSPTELGLSQLADDDLELLNLL